MDWSAVPCYVDVLVQQVDLTRVDGWHSTSVWDNGMWSAESGEESDEEGVPRKVRRSCSGGEWLILPREGVRGEGSGEAGGGMEVDEGSEGDSMVDFVVDDEEEEEDGGGGVCEDEMDVVKDGGDGKVVDGGAM